MFVWTLAISVPVYARSLYYSQIDALGIEESSGYNKEIITEAYDEVLDYLTLHKKFGTGALAYSNEGKAHFEDCQRLFDLNLSLLVVSVAGIIAIVVLALTKKIKLKKYGKFNVWFYAGIVAIALPLVILAFAAINFDQAFIVFHKIMFPGKTNWMFDSSTDEIIKILPEEFFVSCATMIGSVILTICISLIVVDVVHRIREGKQNKKAPE